MRYCALREKRIPYGHRYSCGQVFSELVSAGFEIPDVFGFSTTCTVLIECKTSRSDFLRGKKKVFRSNPEMGMGVYRFYLCKYSLIKPDEIPEKWGLLYTNGKFPKLIIHPEPQKSDRSAELQFAYSVMRRIKADKQLSN